MDDEISFVSVERQIRDSYQYPADKPIIQFFRDFPDLSFVLCQRMENNILAVVAIHRNTINAVKENGYLIQQIMAEKDALIQEKDRRIEEKNMLIQEKDRLIIEMRERMR